SNGWLQDDFNQGFSAAFNKAIKTQRVKALETIMVTGNEKGMATFKAAGLSVAYKPKIKELRIAADKTIYVLAELLAIIE
ncbi:MAG: hypothetical protein WCX20_02340, partial [Candidatus Shapirobacteria bacterium]